MGCIMGLAGSFPMVRCPISTERYLEKPALSLISSR
jgi:hypothetical protein